VSTRRRPVTPAPSRSSGASAARAGWPKVATVPRPAAAALHQPPRHAQQVRTFVNSISKRPHLWLWFTFAAKSLERSVHHMLCLSMVLTCIILLPAVPAGSCADKETPGYSCALQKGWGQCNQYWMQQNNYCAKTCGHCSTTSPAAPAPRPAGTHSLHSIAQPPRGAFYLCARADAYLTHVSLCAVPSCGDKPTPNYSCAQQKAWGQCTASWLQQGGYCAQTCGYCAAPAPSAGAFCKFAPDPVQVD
jgi:hypothetical protein